MDALQNVSHCPVRYVAIYDTKLLGAMGSARDSYGKFEVDLTTQSGEEANKIFNMPRLQANSLRIQSDDPISKIISGYRWGRHVHEFYPSHGPGVHKFGEGRHKFVLDLAEISTEGYGVQALHSYGLT